MLGHLRMQDKVRTIHQGGLIEDTDLRDEELQRGKGPSVFSREMRKAKMMEG